MKPKNFKNQLNFLGAGGGQSFCDDSPTASVIEIVILGERGSKIASRHLWSTPYHIYSSTMFHPAKLEKKDDNQISV